MFKWFIYTGIFAFFVSCEKGEGDLRPEKIPQEEVNSVKQHVINEPKSLEKLVEYYKQYKDHFTYKKKVDDYEFELVYNTHFSLALNNLDSLAFRSHNNPLANELKKFENLHYFTFRISNSKIHSELLKYGVQSEQEYTERIMYYTNNCQSDIVLIEDNDTLNMPFVNFERTFDLAPVVTMTIVFEGKSSKAPHYLNFVFDDKIYKNGKIKFQLEPEIISVFNNPEVKKYNL